MPNMMETLLQYESQDGRNAARIEASYVRDDSYMEYRMWANHSGKLTREETERKNLCLERYNAACKYLANRDAV